MPSNNQTDKCTTGILPTPPLCVVVKIYTIHGIPNATPISDVLIIARIQRATRLFSSHCNISFVIRPSVSINCGSVACSQIRSLSIPANPFMKSIIDGQLGKFVELEPITVAVINTGLAFSNSNDLALTHRQSINGKSRIFIWLSPNAVSNDFRYTVAHELGHVLAVNKATGQPFNERTPLILPDKKKDFRHNNDINNLMHSPYQAKWNNWTDKSTPPCISNFQRDQYRKSRFVRLVCGAVTKKNR